MKRGIAAATVDDLLQLRDAKPSSHGFLPAPDYPSADPARALNSYSSGLLVFILLAVEGELVVGDLVVSRDLSDPDGTGVVSYGVAESYRRHGYGRRLLTEAMSRAAGLGFAQLDADISDSNAPSWGLAADCGFTKTGIPVMGGYRWRRAL